MTEMLAPPCMSCGAEDFEVERDDLIDVFWHKPGVFGLARCRSCGLRMTRPRPVDLAPYYQNAYAGDGAVAQLKRTGEGRLDHVARQRLAVLADNADLHPESQVLDVGCGNGGLLMHLRHRWGCQTTGLDFDDAAFDRPFEPEACTFVTGTLQTAALPAASFDVVLFMESLEHVPDPLSTLRAAEEVLKPGGLVSIEVPNHDGALRPWFGRYWAPYLIPQHLVHFTPETLGDLLERAGFEVLEVRPMFFPLEGLLSLFAVWSVKTGLPPFGEPPRPRFLIDLLVGFWMLALFVLVEVPVQWWLTRMARTGHITVVARPRGD